MDEWKYVFNGFDYDELYNLMNEPSCKSQLYKMCKFMWQKIKDTNDRTLLNSHYPILRVASYGPNIID